MAKWSRWRQPHSVAIIAKPPGERTKSDQSENSPRPLSARGAAQRGDSRLPMLTSSTPPATQNVLQPRAAIGSPATLLLLFAALFAIYNSNLRLIPSLDSDAIRVLPLCILLDRDVYVDRFATDWINTYWHSSGPGHHTHAIRYKRNHWIST